MVTSEAEASTPVDDGTAVRVYRALGDCTRYRIVRLLIERGEVACADLHSIFPLSAPCLSHHTRILQECGLVGLRKEGAFHFFQPRHGMIERFAPALLVADGRAALADCEE